MSIRLPGAIVVAAFAALLALLGALTAVPALAVEEGDVEGAEQEEQPPPDIEEVCAEGSIGAEFCPETYEQPAWFQWILYPLLGVGLLMVLGFGFFYLVWQPRFARERESQSQRR